MFKKKNKNLHRALIALMVLGLLVCLCFTLASAATAEPDSSSAAETTAVEEQGVQHNTEAIFHTLLVTIPEVITYNRHESLRKSGQRYTGKLHRTLQNRQCAGVDISKFLQTAIEDKPNQTFRTCHNEGGYS